MHILSTVASIRGKSLANRQRFLRRAKALVCSGPSQGQHQGARHQGPLISGGEISIPGSMACANRPSGATARPAPRDLRALPATSDLWKATRSSGQAAAAAAVARGLARMAAARTISASSCRARSSSTCSSTISSSPISPRSGWTTLDSEQWRRGRLHGRRIAGQSGCSSAPCRTSLSRRIALRRPRLDDIEELRARISGAGGAAPMMSSSPGCATSWWHSTRWLLRSLYRSDRSPVPPLRALSEADRAGGHVLP